MKYLILLLLLFSHHSATAQEFIVGEVASVQEEYMDFATTDGFIAVPTWQVAPQFHSLEAGESVVLQRSTSESGEIIVTPLQPYRLPLIGISVLVFILMGIALGGRIGISAIGGLLVSIGILGFIVFPMITSGLSPLLSCTLGALLIACTSLYIAHGFNRRTTVALISTISTLLLTTIISIIAVYFVGLTGTGSEAAVFMQSGPLANIDLRGLFLGGIIIGALGVLDDITTAQTAAIDELSKANHSLNASQLYQAGVSIGREHIASLINTLALAYIGAALPLILLLVTDPQYPWWVTLNAEFLAEEIIRTLAGSASLLIAVPISTYIAARSFAEGNHTDVVGGHCH